MSTAAKLSGGRPKGAARRPASSRDGPGEARSGRILLDGQDINAFPCTAAPRPRIFRGTAIVRGLTVARRSWRSRGSERTGGQARRPSSCSAIQYPSARRAPWPVPAARVGAARSPGRLPQSVDLFSRPFDGSPLSISTSAPSHRRRIEHRGSNPDHMCENLDIVDRGLHHRRRPGLFAGSPRAVADPDVRRLYSARASSL